MLIKKVKMGVLLKERRFTFRTMVMPTIINVPLHPKTGRPIMKKLEVVEEKKVHRGWHTYYLVRLWDNPKRGTIYQREIIA